LAALHHLGGEALSPDELHRVALDVIRGVQGLGSGADAAAAVYGGIVCYRADPIEFDPIPQGFPVSLIYSGSKTPTPDVVRRVEAQRLQDPDRFSAIFDAMDQSIDEATAAIRREDWPGLGRVLSRNQEYMARMGVSNDALNDILERLEADPGVHGAKISGSGLGDCVLAVGTVAPAGWPYACIPVEISTEGVQVE
jgi:mevalonate kinase